MIACIDSLHTSLIRQNVQFLVEDITQPDHQNQKDYLRQALVRFNAFCNGID